MSRPAWAMPTRRRLLAALCAVVAFSTVTGCTSAVQQEERAGR